jgi:hypothetical protein
LTAVFIGDDARTDVSALDRSTVPPSNDAGPMASGSALLGPPRLPVHRVRITSALASVVSWSSVPAHCPGAASIARQYGGRLDGVPNLTLFIEQR